MSLTDALISGRRSVKYALIIGSGRLGSAIAGALSTTGTSVVVIDPREMSGLETGAVSHR